MPRVHQGRPPSQVIAQRSGRRTLYDVLQVSPRAEETVLQAAYRVLARANHPDLHPEASSDAMRELNEAFNLLSDPRRRAIYDLELNRQRNAEQPVEDDDPTRRHSSVRRQTSCWRCTDPLEGGFARYCSECHWLVCEVCRSCGCQRPKPRGTLPQRLRLALPRLGWAVAAVVTLGWLISTLSAHLPAFGAGVGG